MSHLLGACSIALEYGAEEDEAIAALLHDAIEDGQPTQDARATVWSFGPEVGRIVEGCTDADTHPKPPWRRRKEEYLSSLATKDHSTLLVSASDKLHNARSIVRDLRGIGDRVWGRFSVSKEEMLWYYRSLVTVYRANPAHTPALVDELDRTVSQMETLAVLAAMTSDPYPAKTELAFPKRGAGMNDARRSRQVVLREVRDERGTRHLAARRRDDGGIVIEGHDLGRGVEVLGPGLSEYEWVWTIPPDAVPSAIEALGGKEGDDPLQLLLGWSTDHGGTDPGTHLREAGVTIAFWSHVGG